MVDARNAFLRRLDVIGEVDAETVERVRRHLGRAGASRPIDLYVNTPGGDAAAARRICAMLAARPGAVHAVAQHAASGGALIWLASTTRVAAGPVLFHAARLFAAGDVHFACAGSPAYAAACRRVDEWQVEWIAARLGWHRAAARALIAAGEVMLPPTVERAGLLVPYVEVASRLETSRSPCRCRRPPRRPRAAALEGGPMTDEQIAAALTLAAAAASQGEERLAVALIGRVLIEACHQLGEIEARLRALENGGKDG